MCHLILSISPTLTTSPLTTMPRLLFFDGYPSPSYLVAQACYPWKWHYEDAHHCPMYEPLLPHRGLLEYFQRSKGQTNKQTQKNLLCQLVILTPHHHMDRTNAPDRASPARPAQKIFCPLSQAPVVLTQVSSFWCLFPSFLASPTPAPVVVSRQL